MRFAFQYTMGRDDFIALNSALSKVAYGRRAKLTRSVFTILGVLFAGVGVMYLQQKHYVAGPIMLLMGLVLLWRLYAMRHLSKRQADRLAANVTGERQVTLEEDCIRIRDKGGEARAAYEDVQRLLFLDQRYFLQFDGQRVLPLPLSALTEGDAAQLPAFFEEKLACPAEAL